MIARQFLQQNDHPRAQAWAQRILSIIPFNREALTILILALLAQQNEAEARRLCDDCASQLAPLEVCSF